MVPPPAVWVMQRSGKMNVDHPKGSERVSDNTEYLPGFYRKSLAYYYDTRGNSYLHSRATKAKHLNRLKGVVTEAVAWSPAQPTISTQEILLGTQTERSMNRGIGASL
ncbi:hypothetical protein BGX38DRAFT_1271912 [Terfezia claveryi]|nr:hypothetical protein BGX38DRAFT_1271912 [Terfezia claveryi]